MNRSSFRAGITTVISSSWSATGSPRGPDGRSCSTLGFVADTGLLVGSGHELGQRDQAKTPVPEAMNDPRKGLQGPGRPVLPAAGVV